jgi:hypothetical protein
MKATFAGWYSKSPEQLAGLWDSALIVPDTNILLHLLRHSDEVRGQLLDVFERKRESLWIPYQVGLEFQRRRLDVQQFALDAYQRIEEAVSTLVNQTKNSLNQYRAHPVLDVDREHAVLDAFLSDFQNRMLERKSLHPTDELLSSFTKVTDLFLGRVGVKPSLDRVAAIQKEGAERYAKKVPPGFEDIKKTADADAKFGDLLIWKEMMEKAKAEKRPLIFITDDGKSDWWYLHRGKKIGPHPALVEEFATQTGQEFHIYELLQFLRYAAGTGSQIQDKSVQKIADSLPVGAEEEPRPSFAEQKALRAELRIRETELDFLIKSVIDLPPAGQPSDPSADKQALKARINELTVLVIAMREQLASVEIGPTV